MKEARNEVLIQASVEEVWEVLTNFAQYSEWNPLIYRVDTKLQVGEKVKIWVKGASEDRTFDCEISKLEPPFEFSWKFYEGMPFLYRGEHFFRIERMDDQWVRFIDREIFEGLLMPFKVKLPKDGAPGGMVAMDNALKAYLESH